MSAPVAKRGSQQTFIPTHVHDHACPPICYFPDELWLNIFSFAMPVDLFRASLVGRRFYHLTNDPTAWNKLTKLIYKFRYQFFHQSVQGKDLFRICCRVSGLDRGVVSLYWSIYGAVLSPNEVTIRIPRGHTMSSLEAVLQKASIYAAGTFHLLRFLQHSMGDYIVIQLPDGKPLASMLPLLDHHLGVLGALPAGRKVEQSGVNKLIPVIPDKLALTIEKIKFEEFKKLFQLEKAPDFLQTARKGLLKTIISVPPDNNLCGYYMYMKDILAKNIQGIANVEPVNLSDYSPWISCKRQ